MSVNAQYNLARPGSLPVSIAGYQRRKMFAAFVERSGVTAVRHDPRCRRDLGPAVRSLQLSRNRGGPRKSRITAIGLDDGAFLEKLHPGLHFVKADGCALPFADGAFDFAHSSAVLEHVGNRDRQAPVSARVVPRGPPRRLHHDAEPVVPGRVPHDAAAAALAAAALVSRGARTASAMSSSPTRRI